MRRSSTAALGLILAASLTACGGSADAPSSDPASPGPGTPAEAAVVASYADDVLWSLHATGGSGAPGAPVPDYEVRADGTVFLSTDDGLGVDTFRLTDAGLDRVRTAFADVTLDEDDYDESDWTDQPVTTLYATAGGRAERVAVYGFGSDDDVEDDDWQRLADAVAVLEDLAESASGGPDDDIAMGRAPYRPAQVALRLAPIDEPSGDSWPFRAPLAAARLQWVASDSCVVLSGRDVAALAARADTDGIDDLTWNTRRPRPGIPATVTATVLPVLRGTPSPCTSTAPERMSVGRFSHVTLGDPTTWRGLTVTDHWRAPTAFDLASATDAVADAAATATGLDGSDLWSYGTTWVIGSTGRTSYVEVAGVYPEEYRDDNPDFPVTWQVRIDAVTGELHAAQVDGSPIKLS